MSVESRAQVASRPASGRRWRIFFFADFVFLLCFFLNFSQHWRLANRADAHASRNRDGQYGAKSARALKKNKQQKSSNNKRSFKPFSSDARTKNSISCCAVVHFAGSLRSAVMAAFHLSWSRLTGFLLDFFFSGWSRMVMGSHRVEPAATGFDWVWTGFLCCICHRCEGWLRPICMGNVGKGETR